MTRPHRQQHRLTHFSPGLNATSFPTQDRVRRRDCGVSRVDMLIVRSPQPYGSIETHAATAASPPLDRQLSNRASRGVCRRRTSPSQTVQRQSAVRPVRSRTVRRPGSGPAPVSERGVFLSAPPHSCFSAIAPISCRPPSCCHTPTAHEMSLQSGPARRRTGRCGCFCSRIERNCFVFFPSNPMSNSTAKEPTSNKPWKVLRSSGVSASIFENSVKTKDGEVTYFKVSLTRTYRDGDEWKSTSSLSRDDLPVAALLLQQAWSAIVKADAATDD